MATLTVGVAGLEFTAVRTLSPIPLGQRTPQRKLKKGKTKEKDKGKTLHTVGEISKQGDERHPNPFNAAENLAAATTF